MGWKNGQKIWNVKDFAKDLTQVNTSIFNQYQQPKINRNALEMVQH